MSMTYRCWAEIDLAALQRNLKQIRAALPSSIKIVAVVKANAYGHGIAPIVARLMRSGIHAFAVANLREAAEIEEIGSGWPILLLSPLLPEEDEELVEARVTPTLSSSQEVERFDLIGQKWGRRIPVHLKIDTGMGRLGVWYEEAAALYHKVLAHKHLELKGICSHFASADSDPDFTQLQRQRFIDTLGGLPELDVSNCLIHTDNSASLATFLPASPVNAVRIGLLQFGVQRTSGGLLNEVSAEPLFHFLTRIGLIKTIPAGTGISYGRTHITQRRTRIGVLTAGYGDGIPTTLSNKGVALVRGCRCPFLGKVTMDQTLIDLTEVPEVEVGDTATLIGRQGNEEITVNEFSHPAQHIPWETFCAITQRVPRLYRNDSLL